MRYRDLRGVLSSTVAVMAVAVSTPAFAQVRHFNIPAQSAVTGLPALAKQADIQLLVSSDAVEGKNIRALKGRMTVDEAIRRIVQDASLQIVNSDGRTFTLAPRDMKRTPSAIQAPTMKAVQQAPQYDEIIVTAQKKEERITDVPIAMSAFSAEALDDYKIEGGSELLRAVPNVNFSKNNFSMYNFSIRGIGTKATSASSDPGVVINFNNTPLVRNRLFEAEFFDMQRIEVLRGPQGTLYGRNATGGVVNLVSALPTDEFEGSIKGETGNYKSRRLSGFLNLPLGEDLSVRVAGAMTKRDGYDYNRFTGERVNGRDLWSTRATVGWKPSDNFEANFIWQHFEEDDDRARTGKNLCTRDPGPERVGSSPLITNMYLRGRLSQGCLPRSLYADAAFGGPNGASLSYISAVQNLNIGRGPGNTQNYAVKQIDPYEGIIQSKDMRVIDTSYNPKFRASNDIFQFNFQLELGDNLTLINQSSYSKDDYYSTQDYNRFVSVPLFNASDVPGRRGNRGGVIDINIFPGMTPGAQFYDPQLGWSDRMLSADLSKSNSSQWYEELRLQSDFDKGINFNVGVNYLNFKTVDKYYVFNNIFTMIAQYYYGVSDPTYGLRSPRDCPVGLENIECIHVEKNSLSNIKDEGHNYFLSKNPVEINSYAAFGELYINPSDNLKITIGARYTLDKKESKQVPSQLLLAGGKTTINSGQNTGGRVNSGYPELDPIKQEWSRFTGRLVVDWKPDLKITDETLAYFSTSTGYKGGGTNPPRVDINQNLVQYLPLAQTFKPESVVAFELGFKNSLLNRRLNLNLTGFLYDYKNYQVSQISDRIAFNENFDVLTWGLEFEAAYRVSERFRVDTNVGYLRTKLKDGAQSIDPMNRTQGNPDWIVLRPWLQAPSNCIAPTALVEIILSSKSAAEQELALAAMCPGGNRLGDFNPTTTGGISYHLNDFSGYGFTYDPFAPYNPDTVGAVIPYDPANPTSWIGKTSGAPNGGRGFYADLKGNELPNSPRLTINVGAEYMIPINSGKWELVLRGDYYRQSKSWWRVYNDRNFDRLKAWDNLNLAISLNSIEDDLRFQFYVKNVFDNDSITDAFLNADDTGLATNVFTVDPRIIGFSVNKSF